MSNGFIEETESLGNFEVILDAIKAALRKIELEAIVSGGYPSGVTSVRVRTDGSVYEHLGASLTIGEDEYFDRVPHELTVWHRSGGVLFDTDPDEEGVYRTEVPAEDVAKAVERVKVLGYEGKYAQDEMVDLLEGMGHHRVSFQEGEYLCFGADADFVDEPEFNDEDEIRQKVEEWIEAGNLIVKEEPR
jgi:hypothetical protein